MKLSLTGLALAFRRAAFGMEHETRLGLEAAGHDIVAHARAKIGHYQEQSGPFSAWQELQRRRSWIVFDGGSPRMTLACEPARCGTAYITLCT